MKDRVGKRHYTSAPILLLLLSLALIACCILWRHASLELHKGHAQIDRLKADLQARELASESRVQATLSAQEAGLKQRDGVIADLRSEMAKLASLVPSSADDADSRDASEAEEIRDDASKQIVRLTSRLDIQLTPVLSLDEEERLRQRKGRLPRDLPYKLLLTGDVDSILNDPQWNPQARKLAGNQRAILAGLLNDFRFYDQISRRERVQNEILPAIELMRKQGTFIEYPTDAAPPAVDGVSISHAEPSDNPTFMRLYTFQETDYPDLYHAQVVESQRSLESFVRIYELINENS